MFTTTPLSHTHAKPAAAFHPNDFVIQTRYDVRFACKISHVSTSKTGRGEHVHIQALEVFTGQRLDERYPAKKVLEVPELLRRAFVVERVREDGKVELRGLEGKEDEGWRGVADVPGDWDERVLRDAIRTRRVVVGVGVEWEGRLKLLFLQEKGEREEHDGEGIEQRDGVESEQRNG